MFKYYDFSQLELQKNDDIQAKTLKKTHLKTICS